MPPALTLMKRRIQGQSFEDEKFENLDLSCALAFGSKWTRCSFAGCDLSGADFSTAKFFDCQFLSCQIGQASFRAAELRLSRFDDCSMRQAVFAGAVLDVVAFNGCKLHYSTFFDATVRAVGFVSTNLHGADLRYIECNEAQYEDVVLWNAQIGLGCQFFNGSFDERSVNFFLAMAARKHPDEDRRVLIQKILGERTVEMIERMMSQRQEVSA